MTQPTHQMKFSREEQPGGALYLTASVGKMQDSGCRIEYSKSRECVNLSAMKDQSSRAKVFRFVGGFDTGVPEAEASGEYSRIFARILNFD